jgi:16S rRNA (uracil1498-N3)-methyltransferase
MALYLMSTQQQKNVKKKLVISGKVFQIIKKIRSKDNDKEIWLAFAPIKINYLNFIIQKATELGVSKFTPILTERTIVRKINEKRINKIIIEASEQSNRLKVPKLEEMVKLDNFLKLNQKTNIIFGDLNTNNTKLHVKNTEPLCILIGPEGDFTEKEREKILKLKNIIPLKINENILRAETAAISMVSIIAFQLLS